MAHSWIARSTSLAALAFLAIVMLASVPVFAEPKFPPLTGRVVDNAKLLSSSDAQALTTELADLEGKSTDQVVVVTLPSLDGYDIADYGYQLGRAWQIGQAGKNNGVLLIVAPNERKVRIEVGRGLEPILTDFMSRLIIENTILPEFRRKDFATGIKLGVRDIKQTLLGDAEEVKQRAIGVDTHEADYIMLVIFAFWVLIVIFVMYRQYRYAQYLKAHPEIARREAQRRIGRSSDTWTGGGYTGGSSWGGSSGGGGFSGGGGDFGGGGSSGDW